MARTKGSDVLSLKKMVKNKGAEYEAAFIKSFTPEIAQLFSAIMATSWTPVEQQVRLYEEAARFIFPQDPKALAKLGTELARFTYSGMYRAFLSIPTIPFIVGKSARLWKAYYDKGEIIIEKVAEKKLLFILTGYPDFPETMRIFLKSHIEVLLSYSGAKQLEVIEVGLQDEKWKWQINWA